MRMIVGYILISYLLGLALLAKEYVDDKNDPYNSDRSIGGFIDHHFGFFMALMFSPITLPVMGIFSAFVYLYESYIIKK